LFGFDGVFVSVAFFRREKTLIPFFFDAATFAYLVITDIPIPEYPYPLRRVSHTIQNPHGFFDDVFIIPVPFQELTQIIVASSLLYPLGKIKGMMDTEPYGAISLHRLFLQYGAGHKYSFLGE